MDDLQEQLSKLEFRLEALEQECATLRATVETLEEHQENLHNYVDKLVKRERAVAAAYNVASDALDPWLPGPPKPVVELDE